MKATLLITTFLMLTLSNLTTNAACLPPELAEMAVAGRTYLLEKSQNSEFPTYLTFGNTTDRNASYGSALDGHPGGEFHFRGNCHGEVIVTFTSDFGSNQKAQKILHLRPTDVRYFNLQSVDDSGKVFRFLID